MSLIREFREFAVKGNVIELAVAVIIGAAFGKIVSSLVADIVMPLVGLVLGGLDFSDLAVQVRDAKIQYGKFIQACVDFAIVAWVIFLAVKLINRFKRREETAAEAAPSAPPRDVQLLEEIRDLLKNRTKS
jgi:large conductance mechanosensitive channel